MRKDTPSKCLDRMVGFLLAGDEVAFRDEVQHFWDKRWHIREISDPKDDDALKYALKACIVERMRELWNMPPKNRFEILPDWCDKVPAYQSAFSVIDEAYQKYFGNHTSPIFGKRNIFAPKDFMFFV